MTPKRLATRCEKQLLRRIARRETAGYGNWLSARREGVQTRLAVRLLRRGLLHAAVSKSDMFGLSPYPWGEIAVAIDPKKLDHYPIKVPTSIPFRAHR